MFAQRYVYEAPQPLLEQMAQYPTTRIAIVGADRELPLQSAAEATQAGLITPLLVGNESRIRALAAQIGWNLDGAEIVGVGDEQDPVSRSIELVQRNSADALAKGHVDTDWLMSGILQRESGLRTGRRLTHVFYLTSPIWTHPLIVSDAALNVAPDLETKRHIALNAISLARAAGIKHPRLAVLSGTEKPSKKMPSSIEAQQLVRKLADDDQLECDIAGPLAMDLAISPEAGRVKDAQGPVIGHADIVIVPTLEAGNILYKTLVYANGATAAGLVMGARIPIVLTSRADPPSARLSSFALAALVSRQGEKPEMGNVTDSRRRM